MLASTRLLRSTQALNAIEKTLGDDEWWNEKSNPVRREIRETLSCFPTGHLWVEDTLNAIERILGLDEWGTDSLLVRREISREIGRI